MPSPVAATLFPIPFHYTYSSMSAYAALKNQTQPVGHIKLRECEPAIKTNHAFGLVACWLCDPEPVTLPLWAPVDRDLKKSLWGITKRKLCRRGRSWREDSEVRALVAAPDHAGSNSSSPRQLQTSFVGTAHTWRMRAHTCTHACTHTSKTVRHIK